MSVTQDSFNQSSSQTTSTVEPYISPQTKLPEITLKAFVLSIILTIVMAGANAYLGLKIGMTVSATIPAAVISMAVLKLFSTSNILENNIVQTAASAGEATASSVVFTLPALLLIGYWNSVPFLTTASLVVVGGLLGVLYTIPLRRAFIVESDLKFPEGVATGEVLKCGEEIASGGAKDLLMGGSIAAVSKLFQGGFYLFADSICGWFRKGKVVTGFQMGFDLVLIGAGYIVGAEITLYILMGVILTWGLGVPLYSFMYGIPEGLDPAKAAMTIWAEQIRIIGVGIMVVGGIWTVFKLFDPLRRAIKCSFDTFRRARETSVAIVRTEHDIPMNYVISGIVLLLLPLAYIFHEIIICCGFELSSTHHIITVCALTLFAAIFGFMVSALGGYLAGLVGSSNSPLSAVVIMSIISSAAVLGLLLGQGFVEGADAQRVLSLSAITIMIASIMANAATISIDNLQDLKSGQIVGATPWKQQVMLIIGVIIGALFITEILDVLYHAYGFGTSLPRPGMNPADALPAPTATLMSKITGAVFSGSMNWPMFSIGAGIAVFLIAGEIIHKKTGRGFAIPPLAFALGIYLPSQVSLPLFIGGFVSYLSNRSLNKHRASIGAGFMDVADRAKKRGLLFASGLIAGEAIMGITLAVPYAAAQDTKLFSLRPENFDTIALVLGVTLFLGTAYYLKQISGRPVQRK